MNWTNFWRIFFFSDDFFIAFGCWDGEDSTTGEMIARAPGGHRLCRWDFREKLKLMEIFFVCAMINGPRGDLLIFGDELSSLGSVACTTPAAGCSTYVWSYLIARKVLIYCDIPIWMNFFLHFSCRFDFVSLITLDLPHFTHATSRGRYEASNYCFRCTNVIKT